MYIYVYIYIHTRAYRPSCAQKASLRIEACFRNHTLSNYASKCFLNLKHAHHTCKGLALLTLLQAHNTIYHVG